MRAPRPGIALFWISLTLVLFSGCSSGRQQGGTNATFRVMTYNIHHGEGIDSTIDLKRIAAVIQETGADIVALQEVDRGVERTNKIDIMTELSDLTGMAYAFGKNIEYQGGDYGNGFLSRFPILEEKNHHYAMIRPGEQRGLLCLVLEVRGREIVVMNTHIDYRPEDTERLMNVDEILLLVRTFSPRPVILCGDFNDTPESRTIAKLSGAFVDTWTLEEIGEGFTYPTAGPKKRIDYVFSSRDNTSVPALRGISARVIHSEASDHLPVLVEFELSRDQ